MFAGQRPFATGADLADGVAALRELMDAMRTCYGPRDRIRAGLWHLLVGDVRGAAEAAAALERRHREEGAIGLLAAVLMLRSRTDLLLGGTGTRSPPPRRAGGSPSTPGSGGSASTSTPSWRSSPRSGATSAGARS